MGDRNFMGGLMAGLGQTLQQQQQLRMEDEFKKSLIEQNKLHSKLFEAQVKSADVKSQIMQSLMQELGGQSNMPSPATPSPGMAPPAATPPMAGMPGRMSVPPGREGISDLVGKIAGAQFQNDPRMVALAQAIARHESNYNPQATSPKGAMGVMQLMPGTAQGLGVQDAYNPEENISGGVRYIDQITQQMRKALGREPTFGEIAAGYNAGPARVTNRGGGIPNIPETQKFVQNVQNTHQELMGGQGQAQPPTLQTPPTMRTPPQGMGLSPEEKRRLLWKMAADFDPGDKKYEYRITNHNDIQVLKDGALVQTIKGGAHWKVHKLDNGDLVQIDEKTGRVGQYVPTPNEMVKVSGRTSEDQPYETFIPKPKGPGQGTSMTTPMGGMEGPGLPGAGGVITGPSPLEKSNPIPESTRSKIGEINDMLDKFSILERTFKPEYVGTKGMVGRAVDTASGVIDLGADPDRKVFNQIFNELLGAKLHERGGSALTKQEIAYIKQTLPKLAESPELFKAGIGAAKLLLQASAYELQAAHLTPDKAKFENAAKELIGQYQKVLKPQIQAGLKGVPSSNPPITPYNASDYMKLRGLQ